MTDDEVTLLGTTRADRTWMAVLLGGGGALLFLAAPWLARWLADVSFVPFHGLLDWVGSLDQPWARVARPVVGLLLGLVATVLLVADEHRLEVRRDSVVVLHDQDRRLLDRTAIVGVYQDGRSVVIDGEGGRVLFREKVESKREVVRAAFVDHGYPWESQ